MQEGVEVAASTNQKDELQLFGNSLENVSQSAADIQQICRVRNKDIRKVRDECCQKCCSEFRFADTVYSSWTVFTSRRRAMLLRNKRSGDFLDFTWSMGIHLHVTCSRVHRMNFLQSNDFA